MKFYYRAMPISSDTIRPMDYITMSNKFAIEHAITTSIYEMEDYGVFMALLNDHEVDTADNPGEYRYIGNTHRIAKLIGIAKYNDITADSEYLNVRRLKASEVRNIQTLFKSLKKI